MKEPDREIVDRIRSSIRERLTIVEQSTPQWSGYSSAKSLQGWAKEAIKCAFTGANAHMRT